MNTTTNPHQWHKDADNVWYRSVQMDDPEGREKYVTGAMVQFAGKWVEHYHTDIYHDVNFLKRIFTNHSEPLALAWSVGRCGTSVTDDFFPVDVDWESIEWFGHREHRFIIRISRDDRLEVWRISFHDVTEATASLKRVGI